MSINYNSGRVAAHVIAAGIASNCILLYNPLPSFSVEGSSKISTKIGKVSIEGEAQALFAKAKQFESGGDVKTAQSLYEQIVELEPDFISVWSGLGNVLVAQGDLQEGLLCYNKALSLRPPAATEVATLLLNRAAVETTLGRMETALRDLDAAARLAGTPPSPVPLRGLAAEVETARALALAAAGDWSRAVDSFARVISSADRDAQPWWLRYSMALLESDRGVEAAAYVQRVLNRYPGGDVVALSCDDDGDGDKC
jgi:tetratricopeptide (TPR) repeat protein